MTEPGIPRVVRRRALQWPVLLWLVLVWVLLWGELSFANVASGVVIGVVVTAVFPLPPISFAGRPRPIGLLRLVVRFVADLVLASAEVAGRALDVRGQPTNAIVRVRLRGRSDLYLTLTAELLSLVPGSVVVEVDRPRRTLYLHILGAADDAGVAAARRRTLAQEERLIRALGSDEELAEFERSKLEGE